MHTRLTTEYSLPLTPLIFRSLGPTSSTSAVIGNEARSQGQYVGEETIRDISVANEGRLPPSLSTRLDEGIEDTMDKFFRVEVSNFALSRFFLSRTFILLSILRFYYAHLVNGYAWFVSSHSVFTIVVVRRGRENLIFASLKRMTMFIFLFFGLSDLSISMRKKSRAILLFVFSRARIKVEEL